jgi:hypothetical protein
MMSIREQTLTKATRGSCCGRRFPASALTLTTRLGCRLKMLPAEPIQKAQERPESIRWELNGERDLPCPLDPIERHKKANSRQWCNGVYTMQPWACTRP